MQRYVRLLNNGGYPDIDQYVGKVFPVPWDSYNLVEVKLPDEVSRFFSISDGEAEYVEHPEASLDVALSNFMKQSDEMIKALEETQAALKAAQQGTEEPKVGDFVKIKSKDNLEVSTKLYTSRCGYVGKIVKVSNSLADSRKVFTVKFPQASFSFLEFDLDHYEAKFYESEFTVVPEGTEGLQGVQPSIGVFGIKSDLKTLTNIPEECVSMTGEFYTEFLDGNVTITE